MDSSPKDVKMEEFMFEEEKNEEQEVVQPVNETEEVVEPQEEPQETESATPQEAVTQEEEGKVPYSRFQEVNEEKNWYKQQLEKQMAQPQVQPQPQPQPTQSEVDNLIVNAPDAQTKEFWRTVKNVAKAEAKEEISSKEKVYQGQIQTLSRVISQMRSRDFRKEFPDIKAGSEDENEIAKRINMGLPSEEAYWAVMGPRGVERQVKKQVRQTIQQKKQANVETSSGVSSSSQTPTKESWEENIRKNYGAAMEGKF